MFHVTIPQNYNVAKFEILFTPPNSISFFLFVGKFQMQTGKLRAVDWLGEFHQQFTATLKSFK